MTQEPKVSIIMPVYNGAKYIKEAIDSALAQSYKNVEIIVVNDGSSDNTDELVKSYGRKVRYFKKENGGVSTALNLGLSKMTGDYFAWLSHDDLFCENRIEAEVNFLRENHLLGTKTIVYSDYYLIDSKGVTITECKKDHDELSAKPEYALLKGNVNGITMLIPKKAFADYGSFDPKLWCTQDYALWHKMFKTYRPVHIPQLLACTRFHRKQTTHSDSRVVTEGNALHRMMIDDLTKKDRERLEGSECLFYMEMADFLAKTPYTQVGQYCRDKIEAILSSSTQAETDNQKVSVVLPIYNRTKLALRALQSVDEQTHKNVEVIVVDDGSTDDISPIRQYAEGHENVKMICLQQNSGAAEARNQGVLAATGQYVAFLDSDDEWLPEKLRKQVALMVGTKANMSHTSYVRQDDASGETTTVASGKDHGHIQRKLMRSCQIAMPTVMLSKEYLDRHHVGFPTDLTIGEDVCCWLRILKTEYLVGLDDTLTIVHTNKNSSAFANDKQALGLKNIITFLLADNYYRQFDLELARIMRAYSNTTIKEAGGGDDDHIEGANVLQKGWFVLKHEGPANLLKRVAKKIATK